VIDWEWTRALRTGTYRLLRLTALHDDPSLNLSVTPEKKLIIILGDYSPPGLLPYGCPNLQA
jgi:hypothetical protein